MKKGSLWEKGFEASKPYAQHCIQNSILGQDKVTEHDYMLRFCKKLKMYVELAPHPLRKVLT